MLIGVKKPYTNFQFYIAFSFAQLYNKCGRMKRGDNMTPNKVGRPPSDNPKDMTIKIRADAETIEKIDKCKEALNTTRSDIVRQGIDRIYDDLKK